MWFETSKMEETKPATVDETATEDAKETTEVVVEAKSDDAAQVALSKNKKRKLARIERARERKRQRRDLQKQMKLEKAKAEGRDLEQERIQQEQARQTGAGRERRIRQWQKHYAPEKTFSMVVDCSFEDQLVSKELNSLAIQLRYIYSANKKNRQPVELAFSSVDPDKTIMQHLRNVGGFEEWGSYGLTVSPSSLEQVFSERTADLVYLTSDAPTILEELDDSKIYIIGGIVDRNRLRNAAFDRAKALNIPTRRLPITEHLKSLQATKVLTCNHVFDLILKVRDYKGDWQKALLEVLPSRKDAKANADDSE